MPLTTVMYHFVYEQRPEQFKALPFLPQEELVRHVEHMQQRGVILGKDEEITDFIGEEGEHRYLLTFDDALLCHKTDVLPMLDERGIKGAFSIYVDSVENRTVSLLEKQRYLQYNLWSYDVFLELFLEHARGAVEDRGRQELFVLSKANVDSASGYLAEEKYYSGEERFFRYCRDMKLSEAEFTGIIDGLFSSHCNEEQIAEALYLDKEDVRLLHESGHEILGHSTTHPIRMDKLDKQEAMREVLQCLDVLEAWTGARPRGFAYPCGRVNPLLFEVVKEAGIDYAFVGGDTSNFDVPGPRELKLFRMDAVEYGIDADL